METLIHYVLSLGSASSRVPFSLCIFCFSFFFLFSFTASYAKGMQKRCKKAQKQKSKA